MAQRDRSADIEAFMPPVGKVNVNNDNNLNNDIISNIEFGYKDDEIINLIRQLDNPEIANKIIDRLVKFNRLTIFEFLWNNGYISNDLLDYSFRKSLEIERLSFLKYITDLGILEIYPEYLIPYVNKSIEKYEHNQDIKLSSMGFNERSMLLIEIEERDLLEYFYWLWTKGYPQDSIPKDIRDRIESKLSAEEVLSLNFKYLFD